MDKIQTHNPQTRIVGLIHLNSKPPPNPNPDQHMQTWKDLDALRETGDYEVVYKKFDAPMPPMLSIVKPHLLGTATKKGGEPVQEKPQTRVQ